MTGRRLRRWLGLLVLAPCAAVGALMALWFFTPPASTLMLWRLASGQEMRRDWTPLDRISPHLARAVVHSEDARFCTHAGIDWDALSAVLEEDGAPSRGASTIPMQTAKNLFLWHGRSYVRKALELPLALALDLFWTKRRILEVYLNVAEWGEGVFGAEAAARVHFGKSAATLTPREAALLAAALPNPILRNAGRPSPAHLRLAGAIASRAAGNPGVASCVLR